MAGATCSATSGTPRMPRQVDASPFRVGENVGATPGQVVFRNEVLEIIQYTPTTPTVRTVPLLIVWSVINRHYILDLAKDRSFIEYALGQGLQVFVTSWRNPTAEHADWDLDTYAQALLDATDAIREITGSEQIGTVGLCAGGQLLAAVMAHLQGAGDDRIAHAGVRRQPDRHVRPERRRARAAPGAARRRPAGHRGGRRRRRPRDRGRVLVAAPDRAGLEPVGQQLPPGQGRRRSTTSSRGTTTPPACPVPCSATCSRIAMDNLLATPGGLTLLGTPVDLGDDHRRHLRRGRRDRPPRPVAGRVPHRPSSSAATPPSSSPAAATSSTSSTRPATPRPTSGPARSPATTPTAGSPARPSSRAAGGRTGRTGRSPGPATSGPLRRSSAAGATGRSRRPPGGT